MGGFFLPAGIAVFSFLVRFSLIGKGPYHYDVIDLITASQKLIAGHGMQYMHGAGYPLHVLLASFFIDAGAAFGLGPVFAVNLMSVLFSSFAVLMLFLSLRRLADPACAAAGALLFSFFPGFLSASVYGINNTVAVFFALAALYALVSSRGTDRVRLICSGLLMGCCAAVRLPEALFAVPLFLLHGLMRTKGAAGFGWFLAPFVLVPCLFYVPMLKEGGAAQVLGALSSSQQGKFLGIYSQVNSYAVKWFADMLTVPVMIFAVFGSVFLFIGKRPLFYFLLVWFISFFFYYANIATIEPRMLIMAGIPVLIAAAAAISRLWRYYRLPAFLCAAAFPAFMSQPFLPVLQFRHDHAQAEEFYSWLGSVTEPGSAVIATDNAVFISFYTRLQPLVHPFSCDRPAMELFFREVDRRLSRGESVYLTDPAFGYDDCRVFAAMLNDKYVTVLIGSHANEEWHHNCLRPGIYQDSLFRLLPKRRT